MNLKEVAEKLKLEIVTGESAMSADISTGFASDILSDVMAKAPKNSIWVTNQAHQNVIALVFFKSLAGVIIAGGVDLDDEALQKAQEKEIPVLKASANAFEVVGRLYALGVRGC